MSKNIEEIKKILGVTDITLDTYLVHCEESLKNKILDICNIDTVPDKLNTLIQDFLIEQYNINKQGIGEGKKEVTGTSDNGQSVNFKTVGGASSMSANAEEFISKNMRSLMIYRKLRK